MRRQCTAAAYALAAALSFAAVSVASDAPPPLGPLPELEAPNPDQVALGRLLFFDTRLSGDAALACASCHQPDKGWTDGQAMARGYPGSKYFRNTQSVVNIAYKPYFYWDARLSGKDAATQVRDKITETHFMNLDGRLMQERLKQVPEYVEMFDKAFGGEPNFGRTLNAIAAFEQTLVSRNAPFDAGDLSPQAQTGRELFEGKAGCIACHNGPMLSDFAPHRTGAPDHGELLTDPERAVTFRSVMKFLGVPNFENLRRDPGYFTVSKLRPDFGKFITPSLREVGRTAPYMHSGVFATLDEVIDFYDRGGGEGSELEALGLSTEEKQALIAFLESLTGDDLGIEAPEIPNYQVIANWREVLN